MFANIFGTKYQSLEDQQYDNTNDTIPEPKRSNVVNNAKFNNFTAIILIASLLANCLLYGKLWAHQYATHVCKSEFAHLIPEIPREFIPKSGENWNLKEGWDSIKIQTGVIALTDDYAIGKSLPISQRYPWDSTKGLYLLQGHHNLHCLKMIRQSILDYRNHSLQTRHYTHIDHCLLALRDDIICTADDTPRVSGGNPSTGFGQPRLCKDWEKLDTWAIEHTACFREPVSRVDGIDNIDLYMHCPDESRPWEEGN